MQFYCFFSAVLCGLMTVLVTSENSVQANYSIALGNVITRNILEITENETFKVLAALGFTSPSCAICNIHGPSPPYFLSIYLQEEPFDNVAMGSIPAIVAWRANEKPLHLGAYVNFTYDGDLILYDFDGSLVWSTGTAGSGAETMALEAPGNLVLRTANGTLVWQSFDHPTVGLLPQQLLKPGMKLAVSIPDEKGYFSLEVSRFSVALYSGSPVYGEIWRSSSIEISHVLVANSSLKIYSGNNSILWSSQAFGSISESDTAGFQLLKIYPTGELRFLSGNIGNSENNSTLLNPFFKKKSLPASCGTGWTPKSTKNSCSCPELKNQNSSMELVVSGNKTRCKVDKEAASCDAIRYNPSEYHMLEAKDYYYYTPSMNVNDEARQNITPDGCKNLCINNCTCNVILISQNAQNTSTCIQMAEVYTLQRMPNAADSTVLVAFKVHDRPKASSSIISKRSHSQASRKHKETVIIVAVLLAAAVIVILAVIFWRRMLNSHLKIYQQSYPSGAAEVPRLFTYPELHAATKGFSKKIGNGGFGSVYEGTLPDGHRIAVKQLESTNQGHKQFRAEVKIIGSIHHKNLVRLKGFCTQKPCYFLVYEYVANGSLEKWIFGKAGTLHWDRRFHIVQEIAKGLAYLHSECSTKVLHLDIKPQNVLLSDDFTVKLSDFGLSRMVEKGEMSNVMTMIRGTPGYMAPEWLQLRVSDKLDVYSFGIVVLEIATGLQALHTSASSGTTPRFLAAWGFNKLRAGRLLDMVDAKLRKEVCDSTSRMAQAQTLVRIGLWCIQPDPSQRPSMVEVVRMLEGSKVVKDPPLAPSEACNKPKTDTGLSVGILMDMILPGAGRLPESWS